MTLLAAAGLIAAGGFWHTGRTVGIDPMTTAAVPDSVAAEEERAETLSAALDALEASDIAETRRLRSTLPSESLDAKIVDWAVAQSGRHAVKSSEIQQVLENMPDWPGRKRLRSHFERAVAREGLRPAELVARFAESPPETLAGAIALARAYKRLDELARAREALAPWWHREVIDARSELLILSSFEEILTREDHAQRFLAMMYRDRIRAAERVADAAGMRAFVKPWAAVIRKQKDAGKLLDAADPAFKKTEHHRFARVTWLRRLERDSDAAELLAEAPGEETDLVDPDEWWTERRIISRDALERGDAKTAYKIAALHRGGSTETRIEAAFHAGWYALRGLKDAEKAIPHFEEIEALSNGAISKSRGAYWLGRAHEALGSQEAANTHYERAAAFEVTYYGQLARQKLGLGLASLRRPSVTRDDTRRFRDREPVAAMLRLEQIGATSLAEKLAVELGRTLDDTADITQLVAHLERRDERQMALRIAKLASWRGIETGALTHPIGAIPASTPIETGERPLAYAIARQESEFNVAARSSANALGLMQLLPGTAREVAAQTGLAYSRDRLRKDGAYNAALGTAYLNAQLDRFDGSYILTFVAYNAGPGRARQWLKRFGDPRGKPLDDVIDWVETIPFTETRNYVQRVMENLQVYKARLGEPADIEGDLRFGRRS